MSLILHSQVKYRKTVGRLAALAVLLAAMMGPWFIDVHPATEDTCKAPLVWLGDGRCACLPSLAAAFQASIYPGQSKLWLICLLPMLPFSSTVSLIFGKGQSKLFIFHLTAWGLTFALSFFLFVGIWLSHPVLLWGAGLSGILAVAVVTGELLTAEKIHPAQLLRQN